MSRAYRLVSTIPSTPRGPNPPGTTIPLTSARCASGPSRSTASECTQRTAARSPHSAAACRSASRTDIYESGYSTYLPTMAMDTISSAAFIRFTSPCHSASSRRPSSASACDIMRPIPDCSIISGTSYTFPTVGIGNTAALSTSQNSDSFSCMDGVISRSLRQISASGWMPMLRSSLTLCCVGFVFSSSDADMYGSSVRCT